MQGSLFLDGQCVQRVRGKLTGHGAGPVADDAKKSHVAYNGYVGNHLQSHNCQTPLALFPGVRTGSAAAVLGKSTYG